MLKRQNTTGAGFANESYPTVAVRLIDRWVKYVRFVPCHVTSRVLVQVAPRLI